MRALPWWRRVLRWVAERLGRSPPERPALPARESLSIYREVLDGSAMNDLRNDAWIAHLRAELPFPQPLYGAAEPPASSKDLLDRLAAVDVEVTEALAREGATRIPEGADPDWFVAITERHLPVASWFAGLGLGPGAPEVPDRFWEIVDRVRRLARLGEGIGQAVERIRERVEQLTTANAKLSSQNVNLTTSYFALLKLHYEALLRPLAEGGGEVEVSFEFPLPGSRCAELSPPPAPGSPTNGTVGRVLCPAVIVRVRTIDGERVFSHGAHVRAAR